MVQARMASATSALAPEKLNSLFEAERLGECFEPGTIGAIANNAALNVRERWCEFVHCVQD